MFRRVADLVTIAAVLLLAASLQAQTTASLTPTSYNFGNQVENTNSSPEVFTLKNTGAHQLTSISISVSGAFAQTHGCGTTLASGNSCSISVAFKPTGTGPFSGTLTVADSATNSPQTASLSGTGVYPVTLNPISLTFNNQVVGTTSATQTVTVKNNESSAVTISHIGTTGDFAETNTCPSSLGSLDTCTISVSFTPTATGTRTGTLSVTDSAPNNPTASLTGNGINAPIPATFFGMDINQNDVVYSPHNPNDYWPGTPGTKASGVSFGTYRTLGSAIKWNDLYDCTTSSYVFEGTGASSNALLSWGKEANAGGQAIMFTAYYTPDCLVPTAIQNSTGMSECAFHTQTTVSGDHEYYGCDLPGDAGDADFKTFVTDLLTYLTNTTYFPNTWPTIYIEVWNEPSNPSECYPATNGNCTQQSLAQMVADAKSIAGDFPGQNIKIISPPVNGNRNGDCTLNGNAENINIYLSQLLAITSPSILSNADIIGFHGYSQIPTLSPPSTYDPAAGASCEASLISSVQSTIGAATTATIPIYDTESSWGTGGNAAIQESSDSSQNTAEEAAFTGAFYLIHASNSVCSSSPCFGMDGVSWYGWDFDNQNTDPGSTGQFWDQWIPTGAPGVLTQAGSTYEILYSWLKGASSVGPCILSQPVGSSTVVGVWTCQFEGAGTSAGLAVWDNSQSCLNVTGDCPYTHLNWSFSSFGTYSEWRDLYTGAVTQLDGATTVDIGLVPILLDNGTEPAAPAKGQKAAGRSLIGAR